MQQPKEETVLEKKVKRKRQRKDMHEANDQLQEMHGVADDLEESRVAAVSSKQSAALGWSEDRSGDARLTSSGANANADGQPTTKKRKNKKKKNQVATDAEAKEAQPQQQQQAESKEENVKKGAVAMNNTGKNSTSHDSNEQPEADDTFKRKRTKKRSRQKNIRKDKRKDEDKPEYLRFGSTEYLGRELTDETKRRLGLSMQEEATTA